MNPNDTWRALHAERTTEGIDAILTVPGVIGVVLGGSVARGMAWPLSDIDLVPVWADGHVSRDELDRAQARTVDWWAASGRAQTLDVGWIAFEESEVRALVDGPTDFPALIRDDRWFHGLDKMFSGVGHGAESASVLAAFASEVRFDPAHRAAREARWWAMAEEGLRLASRTDPVAATLSIRQAARALRLVMVERWSERLGSMGREWTLWQRMADARGFDGREIVELANARVAGALDRAERAPLWLKERIRLSFAGRQLVGEQVSEAENARDQLAAFEIHVAKRNEPPHEGWLDVPDVDLESKRSRLAALLSTLAT